MEFINIICEDNIGLTMDNKQHKITFQILKKNISNFNKIKYLCVNKLNELYNPKYPFFFVNVKNLVNHINFDIEQDANCINVKLHSNNIYKLKFVNMSQFPIFYVCYSDELLATIINIILEKYENCVFGKFMHNDIQLKNSMKINSLNFKNNEINEIKYLLSKESIIDYSST